MLVVVLAVETKNSFILLQKIIDVACLHCFSGYTSGPCFNWISLEFLVLLFIKYWSDGFCCQNIIALSEVERGRLEKNSDKQNW